MFAIGALGVVYLLLWLRNARLLAGSGVIGERNLVGQTTIVQTPEVGRLLIATVIYSKNSTPQRVLYVFSPSGVTGLDRRSYGRTGRPSDDSRKLETTDIWMSLAY